MGAFQDKGFFALGPSENSWQIDAMNAKSKFQRFVLAAVGRPYSRSGNGDCLTASAANGQPAHDFYRNQPAADMLTTAVCWAVF